MDLTQLSSNLKVKTDFNAGSSLGLRDINSITGIVDNSVTSLQALIFPTSNPELEDVDPTNFDVTGITSGYDDVCFVFDIKKEYKYNLNSDITDHYVEDNVAIQDHIGLKPIILEVYGSIGEINLYERDRKVKNTNKDGSKKNIFNSIDSYLGRMGSLTSFAPNIVNQALDVYNSAKFVYSTANKLINFNKKNQTRSGVDYTERYNEEVIAATRQCDWIKWFTTQWGQRASFSIVTPYGVLENMYIMDLSASQPENSRYVTNLNIKFKQIRKAKIISRRAKLSQTRESQSTKTFDIGSLDITKTDFMKINNALAQPPSQTGSVTQVTQQEFENFKAEIQSLNVPSATNNPLPPTNVALTNISMMGGVTMKPLQPPIVMGGAI